MELWKKIKIFSNNNIIKYLLFLGSIFIIAYFFPREAKFKYQFQEGKPWQYHLLTAPFDFPVLKSAADLKFEQDSVLKNYKPYFQRDTSILLSNLSKMESKLPESISHYNLIGKAYRNYLSKQLIYVYNSGIISFENLNMLKNENYNDIIIAENRIGKENSIDNIFTVKSAYEYIIDNAPEPLSKSTLRAADINIYLAENVFFDKKMSEQVKNDLIHNISKTSGLVQTGEKIIDHGEIITEHTYNVLLSLKEIYENQIASPERRNMFLVGQSVIIFGLILCFYLYLRLFRPVNFSNNRDVFFMLLLIVTFTVLSSLLVTHTKISIYVIPYAMLPICIRVFFDSRTALFAHIITSLLSSFMAPFPFEFVLLQITVGMTAVYALKDLTQRSQLVSSAAIIFGTYSLIYLGYALVEASNFNSIDWMMFVHFIINGILLLFTYTIVYIFEKTFGFISSVTLIELSNTNTPLLRRLSEEAPGTFQHVLQVSNLTAEAAVPIKANPLLARTGALYHDIGKLTNPVFFYENQHAGTNPHHNLEFEQSAKILISHVEDGVKIAEKHKLPQVIIDFIQTHHGVSKTKFFYNSFKNKYPDRPINEKDFTYPGPNPFSKETALIMIADAVEAASRSLTEYTEESINNLVDSIINSQLDEGLLSNAPLTFKDIEVIKTTFKKKLKNIYHTRISYPEINNKSKNE